MSSELSADTSADDARATHHPAASLQHVTKRYGTVLAVDDASIDIFPGTVHALIGANGAGKSTLGKILAGAASKDAGLIELNGMPSHYRNPREALGEGVALIAQELALVPHMSVLHNVFLSHEPRRLGFVDFQRMRRAYAELVDRTGLSVPADPEVGSLSIADQQKVEILRAVSRDARIIVMDEPTSSLTRDEIERLHRVVGELRSAGTAIVYVSHFLEHVLAIADTVTVMRNGRVVRTGPAKAETQQSLVTAMLGHEASAEYPPRVTSGPREPVLEVRDLTRNGVLNGVSVDVGSGEIVGLAGLVGSGRSELLRAIFGVDAVDSGHVAVDGVPLSRRTPRAAMAAGISYVPEDRKSQGLFLHQSAAANTTIASLPRPSSITRYGWLRQRRENDQVEALLTELSIKPQSPRAGVATMSGGNQQKVLLGRALFTPPRVLLLDEPTRGVDIGARVAIHQLIGRLAEQGVGILLVSSELEEVLALSHRVLVVRGGRIVHEFGENPPMEQVMQAAFGLEEASTP